MDPDPPFPLKVFSAEEEETFHQLLHVKRVDLSDALVRMLMAHFPPEEASFGVSFEPD